MITRINFVNNIRNINNIQARRKVPSFGNEPVDTFTRASNGQTNPEIEEIKKKDESNLPNEKRINEARKDVIRVLELNNTELFVSVPPEGKRYVVEGDSEKVHIDPSMVKPDSVCVHGHPEPLPLSSGDVACFMCRPSKVEEAVTKDGKFSRLTKRNTPQVPAEEYPYFYLVLEKQLRKAALRKMGIQCPSDKEIAMEILSKRYQGSGLPINPQTGSYEAAESRFNDLYKENNGNLLEVIMKAKEESADYYYNKYTPDVSDDIIVANNDKITEFLNNEPNYETRHEFLREVADNYGMDYETNLN